jgi:hypothetical protein
MRDLQVSEVAIDCRQRAAMFLLLVSIQYLVWHCQQATSICFVLYIVPVVYIIMHVGARRARLAL